jgi:hypothetical protein
MPVIEVNIEDLRGLLGRDVTIEELSDRMPMLGIEWEGNTEDSLQLQIFPNRPDMLSIEGLARAYDSFMGNRTGFRHYDVKESGVTAIIDKKVEKVRPYFVTAIVRNIDFDDALIRSIIQMQEKLHVTHGRKRRKVAIGLHNLEPIEFPITYTTKRVRLDRRGLRGVSHDRGQQGDGPQHAPHHQRRVHPHRRGNHGHIHRHHGDRLEGHHGDPQHHHHDLRRQGRRDLLRQERVP